MVPQRDDARQRVIARYSKRWRASRANSAGLARMKCGIREWRAAWRARVRRSGRRLPRPAGHAGAPWSGRLGHPDRELTSEGREGQRAVAEELVVEELQVE